MGYLIGGIVLAIVFIIIGLALVAYLIDENTDSTYNNEGKKVPTGWKKHTQIIVGTIIPAITGTIGFFLVATWGMFYKMDANTVTLKINSANHKITVDTSQGYHGKSFFDKTIKAPTSVIETNFGDGGLGRGFAGYLHAQTQDSQFVRFSVNVKWRFNVSKIRDIYKERGTLDTKSISNNYLRPIVQKAVEKVAVDYNIRDILGSKRNEFYGKVSTEVKQAINADLYMLESFVFTDTDAGDKIEKAIEKEGTEKIQISINEKQKEAAVVKANQEKEIAEVQKAKELMMSEKDLEIEATKARAKLLGNELVSTYLISAGIDPTTATDDQISHVLQGKEKEIEEFIIKSKYYTTWDGKYPSTLLTGQNGQMPQILLANK